MTSPLKRPICCRVPARFVPEGHVRPYWTCDVCHGVVDAHAETGEPLGPIASDELRRARGLLTRKQINPLWKSADCVGIYEVASSEMADNIRAKAKRRIQLWLSRHMLLPIEQVSIAQFTLAECREAWKWLDGVRYATIRDWAKAIEAAEAERARDPDGQKELKRQREARAAAVASEESEATNA